MNEWTNNTVASSGMFTRWMYRIVILNEWKNEWMTEWKNDQATLLFQVAWLNGMMVNVSW